MKRKWVMCILLYLPCPAAAQEEAVVLAPRFEVGSVRYVEMVQQIDQVSKGGPLGEEGKTSSSTRIRGLLQRVDSVSPQQGTILTLTYDRLQAAAQARLGLASFDSDVDPIRETTNPMPGLFRPMVGLSFVLDIGPDGVVRSARGMDKILETVEEAAAGNPLLTQLQKELTDDNAKLVWGDHRFVLYPDRPVKVGDTWVRTIRTHGVYLGDLERVYQCTLASLDPENSQRMATVRYRAEVRRLPGARPGSRISTTALSHKSGSIEGSGIFDFDRGEFVTQSDTMITQLEAESGASGQGTASALHVTTKTVQTIRVLSTPERASEKANRQADAAKVPSP